MKEGAQEPRFGRACAVVNDIPSLCSWPHYFEVQTSLRTMSTESRSEAVKSMKPPSKSANAKTSSLCHHWIAESSHASRAMCIVIQEEFGYKRSQTLGQPMVCSYRWLNQEFADGFGLCSLHRWSPARVWRPHGRERSSPGR